ncbi:amino acid/polyamine transporter I [Whalleya microplaca]|nr:amino acid/polyamine transporter I [Whalleya microplaca]
MGLLSQPGHGKSSLPDELQLSPLGGDLIDVDHAFNCNTAQDTADMHRLGKNQELKRNFSLISTLGFISIYMATWEFVLLSLGLGLVNGGFGGLFWTFILTVTCYASVVASLAEMESMAPTSGGQYHWVSEFAPASCQRFLSYTTGWMSTLGWLASTTSTLFVCASLVQSLVEITYKDFVFVNWEYTLIALAFISIMIPCNTWWVETLPVLETVSLVGHLVGVLIVVITLWVMCPKNSVAEVFTAVVDNGGWGNVGLSCLVGQTSVLYCNLGSDSAVHISEEVSDASLTVPRVMWWSFLMNTALGIITLITMLFCIGSLEDAIAAEVPYLQLFLNTGSTHVALALTIILLVLVMAGNITTLATTSREVFAFSRDRGFPFSAWLSRIETKRHVPFNAVYATAFWSGMLCLINLGSTFAFETIVSLTLLALLSTYMLSIGCILRKRLCGDPLPPARWGLGRLGLPVNIFAFVYSGFAMVFSCFPVGVPINTSTANWAPAVWAGVILLSFLSYIVHGKNQFTAPVMFIQR